jgi:hypothetical protein
MHIHSANAVVFVGFVVVDAPAGVAAGSVDGFLILPVFQIAATVYLLHSSQNMKELADAFFLRVTGNGIEL